MTKIEFGKFAMALKTYYPKETLLVSDVAMDLWYEALRDIEYRTAELVLLAWVANNRWSPTISDIREGAVKMLHPKQMSEQDAWNCVLRAVGNSIYHADVEFEKLPQIVKSLVGSPTQLRLWAMMDADTLESVVASNFMRSYRFRSKEEQELGVLPEALRNEMLELGKSLFQELPEAKG